MFYPATIAVIRDKIKERYPQLKAKESNPKTARSTSGVAAHILWMCNKIEVMPESIPDAAKAGRWIGWILHAIERDLCLWDNDTSRALVHEDVKNEADIPHF
jgi:hypothetical protein